MKYLVAYFVEHQEINEELFMINEISKIVYVIAGIVAMIITSYHIISENWIMVLIMFMSLFIWYYGLIIGVYEIDK